MTPYELDRKRRMANSKGPIARQAAISSRALRLVRNASPVEAELLQIAALPISRAEQQKRAGMSHYEWGYWLRVRGLTGRPTGRALSSALALRRAS